MEYIIAVLLLLSFFGLVFYCMKGYNLMVGFLIMAILWTILPYIGSLVVTNPEFLAANPEIADMTLLSTLNNVFQSAPESWGGTLVNYIWGAWFGRVLMDTGVAATLIRKTVELSGDKPVFTMILLNIATALIFTSVFGAGSVIAIGVIVLPILMSLGIPKVIALFSFMTSVAAGIFINPVTFNNYRVMQIQPEEMPEFTLGAYSREWGIPAMIIMLVVSTVMAVIYIKRSKVRHAWAAQTSRQTDSKNAPTLALITLVIPVVLTIVFDLSIILGFILAAVYAMLLCGKFRGGFKTVCQMLNKQFYDGIVETAPLLGFLLTLAMFNFGTQMCAPYFEALLGDVIPSSTLLLCIAFAVLAPLALFRGPLTLAGCGAVFMSVISAMGFPVRFVHALFVSPTITMNLGSCITQSWVAWGLTYTKVEGQEFLKKSIPSGWIVVAIQIAAVYLVYGHM